MSKHVSRETRHPKETPPEQLRRERTSLPNPAAAAQTRANYQAAALLKRELHRSDPQPAIHLPLRQRQSAPITQDPEVLPDRTPAARKFSTSMSKPVLFYGKPNQLDDVLTFCRVKYITDGIIDEQAKAGYLASLFRGTALAWLTAQFKQNKGLLDDYDDFLGLVKASFELNEVAAQAQAARALANIRQKGSAQDYGLRFSELARAADIPSATAIALFTKGLKRHIRSALIINDERSSLKDAIEEATRIDSQLYFATPRSGPRHSKGPARDGKGKFKKSPSVKTESFDY
jgi:hypothetical protein